MQAVRAQKDLAQSREAEVANGQIIFALLPTSRNRPRAWRLKVRFEIETLRNWWCAFCEKGHDVIPAADGKRRSLGSGGGPPFRCDVCWAVKTGGRLAAGDSARVTLLDELRRLFRPCSGFLRLGYWDRLAYHL